MIKVMAADLQKCCSEDDLPTVPWRFPLSFFPFLVVLYAKQKHLGYTKVRGLSEATLQTGRHDQKV